MASKKLRWPASLSVLLCALCYVQALDNGLGSKPPMGVSAVSTWQQYLCVLLQHVLLPQC